MLLNLLRKFRLILNQFAESGSSKLMKIYLFADANNF